MILLSALGCLFYFGMAQALDHLARTAFTTDRMCALLEQLRSTGLNQSNSQAVTASTAPGKVGYYYSTDGTQQGPVDANDLKMMRKDGLITEDTPILREGDSEWRRLKDFPTLGR